jgi:hypothetical protein
MHRLHRSVRPQEVSLPHPSGSLSISCQLPLLSKSNKLSPPHLIKMSACPAPAPAVATFLLVALLSCCCQSARAIRTHGGGYVSAVGDPGMRRDGLRVAWEAWNFCNEVGQEAPGMGSPRGADCFHLGPCTR